MNGSHTNLTFEPGNPNQLFEWNRLLETRIWVEIKNKWNALLENKDLIERDYHNFLKTHPAIFFCIQGSYLAISKLKLGADHETDFVVAEEGYSDGTIYELIEIESPHTELFNSEGNPSKKFNHALQQIRDWRRYLKDNRNVVSKIFPTTSTRIDRDSRLKFKIIIGRRTDDKNVLQKRAQIAEETNIEIWSFDRLTDMINNRTHFHQLAAIHATEMNSISPMLRNQLANPFFQCTGDSEWRKICKTGSFHIYSRLIYEILEIRKYNNYFDEFKKIFH